MSNDIVIFILGAIITLLLSFKFENEKRLDNNGINKRITIIVSALLIVSTIFATLKFISEDTEKRETKSELVAEKVEEKQRYDTTLEQLKLTLTKSDSLLDSLREVHKKVSAISNNLIQEQSTQREISTTTKTIQEKSLQLLRSQTEIQENTERMLHPLFPLNVIIHFQVSADSKDVSPLVEYLDSIKGFHEYRDDERIKGMYLAQDKFGKIERIFLDYCPFINSNFNIYSFCDFEVCFIKGQFQTIHDLRDTLPRSCFRVGSQQNKSIQLEMDFKSRTLFMDVTFIGTEFLNSWTKSNSVIGTNELLSCSLYVSHYVGHSDQQVNDLRLNSVQFLPARGMLQPLAVPFDENDVLNSHAAPFDKSYIHRITKKDSRSTGD